MLGVPLRAWTAHVVPFGVVGGGEGPHQLLSELHDARHDTFPGLVYVNLPIGRCLLREGSPAGGPFVYRAHRAGVPLLFAPPVAKSAENSPENGALERAIEAT
jgi:hypothetical protein